MVFRNIIFCACFIGLLAGCLLTFAQALGVTPIILAAEQYEIESTDSAASEHGGAGHSHAGDDHHEAQSWAPEDGTERTLFTLLANVLAGIGFAVVLLALMTQAQLFGLTRLSLLKGLGWGLAGFAAFFLVPGIGLPPEIPGIEAAALEHRQAWWLFAVLATGVGLAVLAFAPIRYKLLGPLAIAAPFFIGAPSHQGPEFSHPDANAVIALSQLHHDFILASGLSNLMFWLVLGVMCAFLLNRRILTGEASNAAAPA